MARLPSPVSAYEQKLADPAVGYGSGVEATGYMGDPWQCASQVQAPLASRGAQGY